MKAHVAESRDGFTLKVDRGDRSSLLAFDLDAGHPDRARLAGFAVIVTGPDGRPRTLANRLTFRSSYTSRTTAADREWTPSDQAPLQKFRWSDFPPSTLPGTYRYAATAMLFGAGATDSDPRLEPGPTVETDVQLVGGTHEHYEVALTRGYLSSQAYAETFKNADIRPPGPKTIDYDTTPFRAQYEWLGGHARELLFRILGEATSDPSVEVDAFTYDLDEPDVIKAFASLGRRLRVYQDNASLHVGASAMEPKALAVFRGAGAAVETGHFRRFQHNKVLILKRGGRAYKVLAGSANFSVRGLYVQANNVFVYDDPSVASLYSQAFDEAWGSAASFARSPIATKYFPISGAGIPTGKVAFSPHTSASVSLGEVAAAIKGAKSSLLFAVMELGGGGDVLASLRKAYARKNILSLGVTQALGANGAQKGSKVYTSSSSGILVPFAALDKNVPEPFRKEWSGGMGQVIHDKFVVVDFNDTDPVVFAGSSNLAEGGEVSNGDNLVATTDRLVVSLYAVEAIRLVDHYAFRAALHGARSATPLALQGPSAQAPWWAPYYDPKSRKYMERVLLAR
jgi:phosphatidylserine/phosphatidylglycerophosphate/cardiolipin synthase-like enzyme